MADTELSVSLSADASALDKVMDDLEARARSFGSALTSALEDAVVDGESLEDVLVSLGERLSSIALDAGLKPLQDMLSKGIGGLAGSAASLFGFADGGVPGKVQPFAAGGIVSAPTFFPMGRDVGLMGEAGSEAIMPLKRGPDGRLGVAAAETASAPPIVFNVQARDVESFRKSEGQIAAMLSRTVGRGRRGL